MEKPAADKMKVLIIQTAFPGDAILTLPMIQVLKKSDENILIDVLCTPSTKEIFQSSPAVNSTIVIDKKGAQRGVLSLIEFVKRMRLNKYDKVYSPHRSFRSALIVWLLGIPDSTGFSNSNLPFVYSKVVTYDHSSHEVRRNLSLIGYEVFNDDWKIRPELSVTESSRVNVENYLSRNELYNFIAVAPGSAWNTKMYPADYYLKVIEFFINRGYKVILIGGKEDRSLSENLIVDQNVSNASGLFSFAETAELLRRSKLLITNDSAPTHLGICADIPVLTVYCSTVADFGFYPYSPESDFLSYDELDCKPCGIHGHDKCPVDNFDCAKLLHPESVIEKAKLLIEKYGK